MAEAPGSILHADLCKAIVDDFTTTKVFILGTTIVVSLGCYISCFILGARNLFLILREKDRPRSLFMMLQYVFGQLTCVARVLSLVFISALYFSINNANYCKMTHKEFQSLPPSTFDGQKTLFQFMYIWIVLSMMAKFILGLVTVSSVKMMALKMKYVQELRTLEEWEVIKAKVYKVMFFAIGFTVLLTAICATRISVFLGAQGWQEVFLTELNTH